MIKKLFNPILTVLCILTMLAACTDDAVVENTTLPTDEDVTICFDMTVPGLAKATRTAVSAVDEEVTSLHLFLFDHRGGFTKVVEATRNTNPTYDNSKKEYTSTTSSGFGTYTATIPGNTTIIHFVANYNYKEEGFDEEVCLGRTENAVMAPLTTTSRLYWGRYKYSDIKAGNTVVLYRNYAKVSAEVALASDESTNKVTDIKILGWTLCHEPVKASVTPFNTDVPDNSDGTPGNLLDGAPYAFTLTAPFVTLPAPLAERQRQMTTADEVYGVLGGKTDESNPVHTLFEHTEEGYGHELYAIFKLQVEQQVTGGGTQTTTRYYKIKLLEDTKLDGNVVIERTSYDIYRNHQYVITFKGIEPEGGYGYATEDGRTEQEAIQLAMTGLPANNSTVDIKMTIPEVQSADYVLRIEGSTVRYYKDITSNQTIQDIEVYFAPLAGGTTTSVSDLSLSWENTTWSTSNPALSVTAIDDKPNYYRISFPVTPFVEGENGDKHYKYGVIRVSEKKEYLLSRFVQVFIGAPITFRPLLVSSDIPSRIGERLTVMLKVPDLTYLPEELYPIQLTFGSDRVDVEKNLDVEQMKVDFDGADYDNVLRYKQSGDKYAWTTAGNTAENEWGYKYVYTLESPEEAGTHRITLRTVTDSNEDFNVMLEGKSLVTGTQVFNTRELEFKMQDVADDTDERRIMIDGAMEETRLTTAYLYQLRNSEGNTVTVNYTLGQYDEETHAPKTGTLANDVKLWVYYDSEQLTPPSTMTPKKDAENNWFVELTHPKASSTGSISFTATDVVKDAVVLIMARGKNNYGTYNTNNYSDTGEDDPTKRTGYGDTDFLYTGVNDAAQSFRSASAIINVLSTWEFNPAISTDGVDYKQESEVELPYGKDVPLYVRIEKLANKADIILKLTSPTLQIQEDDATDGVDYYDIVDASNGIIKLKATAGDFCYLKFLTTTYINAGELKLTAVNNKTSYGGTEYTSSVPYTDASVTVVNAANTFAGFKYANETDLTTSPIAYYDTDADDKSHRTVRAVKGSRVGIRVFFPGTFKEQTESFTFKMKSACYLLHNDGNYKYTAVPTNIGDGSHIITVKENGLTYVEANDLCYLDLVLCATTWNNSEDIRFLTDATNAGYIRFYPYNISLISDGKDYPITVKHSLDGTTWSSVSEALSSPTLATAGTSVYYQITLPGVGKYAGSKPFDFTISSDGLEMDNNNTNNQITGVEENGKFVYKGLVPTEAGGNTWVLALKTSKALNAGESITATIDPGETVNAEPVTSELKTSYKVTYSLGSETAEGIVAPESVEVSADNPTITIPKNFTLYKKGYTLTAWTDGTNTYTIGQQVTVTGNMALTPVFTANTESLDARTEAVTMTWNFGPDNGSTAGYLNCQSKKCIYVTRATVNGKEIDVKMDIDATNGKINNVGRTDTWAQVNNGTIFTVTSCKNATVEMEAYKDISTTTVNGSADYTSGKTITATVSDIDVTTDIVINDGAYYSYVKVTLPAPSKTIDLPETTDIPLNLHLATISNTTNGYVKFVDVDVPQFDCFDANGVATFTLNNTEANAVYEISFGAATALDNEKLHLKIVDDATGTVELNQTITVPNNGWQSFTTLLVEANAMKVGTKTFTITFDNGNTSGYTSNVNNIVFKLKEVVHQFSGITTYSTASSLGSGDNYKDCVFTDEAVTDNEISVKAFTNQITLKVAATGNSGSTPAISSSNYTLSETPIYADGYWTLVLGVTNLVDEDITISCNGYSNSQTASINVRPYVTASVDKTECYIGEIVTVTVTAHVTGSNKTMNFYVQDRGNGSSLTYTTGSGSVTTTDNNQHVTVSNLSAGTFSYTYQYTAKAATSNNILKVIPKEKTDYLNNNKFDASSSNFNVKVNALPTDVYEYYVEDEKKVSFASETHTEEEKLKRKTIHVYKNGVSQENTVIDVLQLYNYYTYRDSGKPVTVETYNNGSKTFNQGEHMNQENQYIILNIPYPMVANYKWVPRGDNSILNIYDSAGNIITTTHKDVNGGTVSTFVNGTLYDVVNQKLDAGTYKLKSNSETVLWYLKLSPYTP